MRQFDTSEVFLYGYEVTIRGPSLSTGSWTERTLEFHSVREMTTAEVIGKIQEHLDSVAGLAILGMIHPTSVRVNRSGN